MREGVNQDRIMVKIMKNTIRKIPINQDRIMVKIMLKIPINQDRSW